MIRNVFFLYIAFFCSTCNAEPSLDETISFMSTLIANDVLPNGSQGNVTTISNDGCNIRYTNHPKYNRNKIDDIDEDFSFIYFGDDVELAAEAANRAMICQEVTAPMPDQTIREKAGNLLGNTFGETIDEISEIKEGFFDYFSEEEENKEKLVTNIVYGDYYPGFNKKYAIFLTDLNLSNLNPNSIKRSNYGFIVKTTNTEKLIKISSFDLKDCDYKLKKVRESEINEISFYLMHLEKDQVDKFRKALEHVINLCGGKRDLF